LAWLTADDHDVAGWAPEPPLDELHCHPDLAERLTEVSRPVVRGAARVWVDGCPVIHHPRGAPLACASGTGVLVVRSAEPAGALAASGKTSGLDPTWVDLDPWAPDTAFARSTELLRMHLRRASELAEARAWH
jgi:hypothetical protein